MKHFTLFLTSTLLLFNSCQKAKIDNSNTTTNSGNETNGISSENLGYVTNTNSPKIESDMLFFSSNELVNRTQISLIALNAQTGSEIWRKKYESSDVSHNNGILSPTISENLIYFSNFMPKSRKETLFALDILTGEEKWKLESNTPYNKYWLADNSTPTVSNNIIYWTIGRYDTKLYAIDSKKGIKLWEFDGYGMSSPIVFEGMVYFYSKNAIFALDAKTGNVIWSVPQKQFNSQITIADGQLIIGGEKEIFTLNAKTGGKGWSFNNFEIESDYNGLGGSLYLYTTPTVENGNIFFIFGRKLYSLNLKTGSKNWETIWSEANININLLYGGNNATFQSPNVFQNRIYFFSRWDKSIFCFDSKDGKRLWKNNTIYDSNQPSYSTVISDKYLYSTSGGTHGVFAINTTDGTIKWRVPSDYFSTTTPIILTKDGKIFSSPFSGSKQ